MQTYKIIRIEKIQEEVIVQAKNEKQAMVMFENEKMETCLIRKQNYLFTPRTIFDNINGLFRIGNTM